MTRRPLVVVGLALTVLGAVGLALSAVVPHTVGVSRRAAPLALRVTDATTSACRNGEARWRVGADVRASGRPGGRLTLATLYAAYARGTTGGWHPVPVARHSDDAFAPGQLLGDDGSLRAHPNLDVTLPCDVGNARLIATSRVGADGVQRADAAFVSQGIPMSASSVGGVVVLVLVAAVAASRLSSRRAPA